MNVSNLAETLATRIVWCSADVWNVLASLETLSFWMVSSLHELLQHVFPCQKLNVSNLAETLATRIILYFADVWNVQFYYTFLYHLIILPHSYIGMQYKEGPKSQSGSGIRKFSGNSPINNIEDFLILHLGISFRYVIQRRP